MAASEKSLRLFVAIDLEQPVLARARRVLEEQQLAVPYARWVAPHQLHVTLSFLGQVTEASVLDVGARVLATARRFSPFSIKVCAAGGFPNARRPAVVWLGVEPDTRRLVDLAGALEQAWKELGRSVEERAYHPHLTLARSRQRSGDVRLAGVVEALAGAELGSSAVGEIVLYRSDSSPAGARYTALLRAPLEQKKTGSVE